MGQTWRLINPDKLQFIDAQSSGGMQKWDEQFYGYPGPYMAQVMLKTNPRRKPENVCFLPDAMTHAFRPGSFYGLWCGDKTAFAGDYTDNVIFNVYDDEIDDERFVDIGPQVAEALYTAMIAKILARPEVVHTRKQWNSSHPGSNRISVNTPHGKLIEIMHLHGELWMLFKRPRTTLSH